MDKELSDVGYVRRANERLLSEFFGLKTEIYHIENHHYAIRILNYIEHYKKIEKIFHDELRTAGIWIDLTIVAPSKYSSRVEPLPNVAYNHEGIALNEEMFRDMLVSRFPNISIIKTEHYRKDKDIICKITVGNGLIKKDEQDIKDFIFGLKTLQTKVEIHVTAEEPPVQKEIDVAKACIDKSKKYSVRDAEFWFGNVQRIYEGSFKKDELYFFDENKTKCYMDFSIGENVNIRNGILLYDQVYLEFPLAEKMQNFLDSQKLKEKDLIDLVERNKMVILLENTEDRYDTKIISKLYDANPNSVVSKRGINSLMATYYCELEKNYLSFLGDGREFLERYYMESKFSDDYISKFIAEWLTWPMRAKANSFELLDKYGPIRMVSIGTNCIFDKIPDLDKNIVFNLTVNSNAIHISTALQATYYPFYFKQNEGVYSDFGVASLLGAILNSYQYGAKDERTLLQNYAERMEKSQKAISLLDTNTSVDLSLFMDYSEKYNTSKQLSEILLNLSVMSDEDCNNKISEYNNLIAEIGMKGEGGCKEVDYILSAAGLHPEFGVVFSVGSIFKNILNDQEKVKRNKAIREIQKISECTKGDAENVYLLDRISRVAKLQKR